MIEGLWKLDVDGRTDRAAGEAGVGGLEDVQLPDEVGAYRTEVETAGGIADCGRDLAAVIQGLVELRAETAHGNLRRTAAGRSAARAGQ